MCFMYIKILKLKKACLLYFVKRGNIRSLDQQTTLLKIFLCTKYKSQLFSFSVESFYQSTFFIIAKSIIK